MQFSGDALHRYLNGLIGIRSNALALSDAAANLGDAAGDELVTTAEKAKRFGGNRRMLWDADALTYRRYATRGAFLW